MERRVNPRWMRYGYFSLCCASFVVGCWLVAISMHEGSSAPPLTKGVSGPLPLSQTVDRQPSRVEAASDTDDQPSTPRPDIDTATTPVEAPSISETREGGQPSDVDESKPQSVRASLTINGVTKGIVAVTAQSSHCDLLTQAHRDGLIASLDMRYSTQYKSYAVYVIDGIGDDRAVWWTYEVNGSPPPLGCSHMTVREGDAIHWQYQRR